MWFCQPNHRQCCNVRRNRVPQKDPSSLCIVPSSCNHEGLESVCSKAVRQMIDSSLLGLLAHDQTRT